MLGIDSRIAKYTWTIVLILMLIGMIYLIGKTLFIFVVALLFAYLLWPLVNFLEKHLPGRSKLPSLTIVYLLLVGLLIAVGVAIGSKVSEQANSLFARIPELISKFEQPVSESTRHGLWGKVLAELQQQVMAHSREIIIAVSNAITDLLSHAEIILFIALIPILSFYFLKDGRGLISGFLGSLTEGSNRDVFKEIINDLHVLLAQYMRSLVLLGLAASIAYSIFFSIIGLPYGLLLGTIAFFFEFVPLVGPLTSSIIILLVAGVSGFGHFLWIGLFLLAFRLFQDYVLAPMLMSAGMELHPLLVIFGVLAGGQIAGIAGTFLSVPVLATLRIIYRQLQKKQTSAVSYLEHSSL
jgi:predicted PurR-regulated permease PerM